MSFSGQSFTPDSISELARGNSASQPPVITPEGSVAVTWPISLITEVALHLKPCRSSQCNRCTHSISSSLPTAHLGPSHRGPQCRRQSLARLYKCRDPVLGLPRGIAAGGRHPANATTWARGTTSHAHTLTFAIRVWYDALQVAYFRNSHRP